jgi:hypothetical protein
MNIPEWLSVFLAVVAIGISIVSAVRSSKKVDSGELQKVKESNAVELGVLRTHIEWIVKFIPPEDRGGV